MVRKALAEMTFTELSAELAAARQADQAAEYQEGLNAWRSGKESAAARLTAVKAEIDQRFERMRAAGGVPVEGEAHGG